MPVKQSQAVVWVQEGGNGTALKPYAAGDGGMSMTGKSIPVVGVAPVYGRDRNGNPVVIDINTTPPGDLPTATVNIFEQSSLTVLERLVKKQCPINMQLRVVDCGVLDNPSIWDKMLHWSQGILTTYSPGDGPAIEFDGTLMQSSGTLMFRHVVFVTRNTLSNLTITHTENATSIAGLPDEDCNRCGFGYPGADQILIVGMEAVGAATAKLFVSGNGGGSWATTSTDPFAADEHIDFVAVRLLDEDTVRYIVGTGVTDAAAQAKIAYADVSFGDLLTTSWTTTLTTGGTNGDVVTALGWLTHDLLYIATDADEIYLSEDQGESFGATAAAATGDVVRGFALSPDLADVWAFGDAGTLLRSKNEGAFVARTSADANAIASLVIAGNGIIYAGQGTKVFKNTDNAQSAGNWVERKDFGASHAAIGLQAVGGAQAAGGDSEILRAVVDDSTPGAGTVFESQDGGLNWSDVTELSNGGYNAAYFSEIDDNLVIIACDLQAAASEIQQLSPA